MSRAKSIAQISLKEVLFTPIRFNGKQHETKVAHLSQQAMQSSLVCYKARNRGDIILRCDAHAIKQFDQPRIKLPFNLSLIESFV